MILADTNIIIDFWNKPAVAAEKIFSENDIAICGVIKTELLRGSQSADDFAQIQMSLADFYYLNFAKNDWVALAKQFITLKKHGLVVPFQDAMIAFLAIKYDCEVWTNDKHFKLMQTAIPQLKLFSPRK
ncbi:PIN domain-containing protein [Treponema socranskii]|uniref:PIN domain-containing protein n=1 Tax=Treponema socranskii TaxID=53419 RepID=UPI0023F199E8|nr:PIN domain-containing protein [Treponema socranskii]